MRQKWFTAKHHQFRTLKAATFAALAGGAIWLSGPGIVHAAVLSVGSASNPFNGAYVCADVSGGVITSGNKVQAWDCHAGPNQQYEFLGETQIRRPRLAARHVRNSNHPRAASKKRP
jgi:hypothetical protein